MRPVDEQGIVIPAWNIGDTDYVVCAKNLAKSLLTHDPNSQICLLTNVSDIPNSDIFSHIRVISDINTVNPWANDALVFWHTPFRETIKLEADMLMASSIDHWWTWFRHRDVVISTGCRNWHDQTSARRDYRAVFDDNNLPDVYNAITYWRLSFTAKQFFYLVRDIFDKWSQYRTLIKFSPEQPDTDLVYAMAAQVIGQDLVTLPGSPTIVHMKQHHAGTVTTNWTQELVWETNPLRINTVAQWGAFHYNVKTWQP